MATTAQLIDVLACDKVDSNGDPLNGYKVRTYASDGTTPANVWEERAKSTAKSEFTLDATGYAEVYGDNTYIIHLWPSTGDPDVDSPYLAIGPVTYSFDAAGDVTGDVTGDVKATDGTVVLDNGTNGTDATIVATVTGDVTGDLTGNADTATLADAATKAGVLNIKVIEIGDWNMNATNAINLAHGLTLSKIRDVSGSIRNDAATIHYQFTPDYLNGAVADLYINYFDVNNVQIARRTTGFFDAVDFDSTSYNRGWVLIWYID